MRRKRKSKLKRRPKAAHRIAPMPKWFNDTPWGCCRWCNENIYNDFGEINSRRRWHKNCLHEYLIITDSKYAKRAVKKRDKGVCVTCKTKCKMRYEWQLDHKVPLKEANGDIKFWQMGNLQTLCVKCHKNKTGLENAERRRIKTARKKR